MSRPRVLIVGAGFAGFHCALELERQLGESEAELMPASPADCMLYSPLLPQVAAGVLAPQPSTVSLGRALRWTLRAPCSIPAQGCPTRRARRPGTGRAVRVPATMHGRRRRGSSRTTREGG